MVYKHYAVYMLLSILLSHNAVTHAILIYAPDGTIYDPDKPMGPGRVQRKETDDSSQMRHVPPQNPFAPAETGTAGRQNKNPSRSSTSGISTRTK
jgi:hypothetical protein